MNILIDAPLPEKQANRILALSPRIELVRPGDFGRALSYDQLRHAEIIYTESADFDPVHAPRLRWVQINTVAADRRAHSRLLQSPIPVANVAGAYSPAVAECAFGMLLALTRRIKLACEFQGACKWPEDYGPWAGDDLYGATMGIVGYGSIGRQIARIAQAVGLTILAYKRRPLIRTDNAYSLPGTGDPEGIIPKAWFGPGELVAMLRQTDVAMITLPHVPSTEGMVGKDEIAALPQHAYLVNVGRGAVIDEAALVSALASGKIAGAALDVFTEEPLARTSPLWKMPNALVLPHIASYSKLQAQRAGDVLMENLQRDIDGRPLLNLLDKKRLF